MAVTSGFFNSVNGDRRYNAEQMSMFFDKLISSGVYPNPSTNLQVIAGGGLNVDVLAGRGMIDCRWLNNDSTEILTLEQSDAMLNRIDAVIMKLDLNDAVRDVHLEIKKGTPATTPVAPVMERSTYVKEYCLATVYVKALAEHISQADITDTRANTAVCGWVTGLIDQVDTETLFLQWQTAYEEYYRTSTATFEEWFARVSSTLTANVTIKRTISTYETTSEGESVIPIGISNYNMGLDFLNVYINGLRLIDASEYTINNGSTITLASGVHANTPILFEVYKIVDSTDVWSAVEMLEDAQPKIYKNVTVPVSAWARNGSYYESTIANETIDENTFVNVSFNLATLGIATDAGVLGVAESANGGIRLYSTSIPSGALVCDYTVQKGRVI